jgi:Zn-dependent metalloprotease
MNKESSMKWLVGVLLAGLCASAAFAGGTSVVWQENGKQPIRVRVAPESRKVAAKDAKPGLSGTARELLAMWGVRDADAELAERLRETDFLGREHVRYRQVHLGLEVDGRELIVHRKDGAVYEVNGNFLEGVSVGTAPSVGAEEAVALAADGLAGAAASGRAPVLVVWCEGEDGAAARLAWRVRVQAPGNGERAGRRVGWFVFVDALDGRVLDARPAGTGKAFGAEEGDGGEENREDDICAAAMSPELMMHAIANDYPEGPAADIRGPLPWQLGGQEVSVSGIETGDGRKLLACTNRDGLEVAVYEGLASPRFVAAAKAAWEAKDKAWFEGFHTNIAFVEYRPDDPDSMPQDAMAIAWNVGRVLEWMQDEFGRASYDGQGTRVACWQFWNDEGANLENAYANACWVSEEPDDGEPFGNFFFGYDRASGARCEASFDTCAHELTHGVTDCTAGLLYQGESGALNESFSDLFAVTCEFACQPRAENVLQPGPGEADWLFDEDAAGNWREAARSYAEPGWKEQPSRYGGTKWRNPAQKTDNGWVHFNSGVQNHFFYLLCEGGKDPVDGVCENDGTKYAWFEGLGMEKAAPLAYLALTSYCGPMTRYRDVVECWLSAAEDLLEEGLFAEEDAETVRKAWAAVMPVSKVRFGSYEPGSQVVLVGAGAWDPESVKTVADDGTVELQVPAEATENVRLFFRIGDDLYRADGGDGGTAGITVAAETNALRDIRPQEGEMALAGIETDPESGYLLLVATVTGGDRPVSDAWLAPKLSELVRLRWTPDPEAMGKYDAACGEFEFRQFAAPYLDEETEEPVPDTYNLLLKAPTNAAAFFWLAW